MSDTEPILIIDAEAFARARRDPRVRETLRRADEYGKMLVDKRGHCSQCLVVNCEHITYLGHKYWETGEISEFSQLGEA